MLLSHGEGFFRFAADDAVLRSRLPCFNGLERPFVLIPHDRGDGRAEWRRHSMEWNGNPGDGTHTVQLAPLAQDDAVLIRQFGVAFGLETNVGTVWMQGFADNYFPNP